ncbi:hypothetical protein P691DRAFT_808753 [Macrolepiota fuliginosa MF-IS2]|uniref:DUF6593 domain-containing protein n=1 Tax=Macrolepiota fuliginosa MF-IS2 TaxID=1400762 RepID=A0A9P5XIR1_9AGAR|nr:hypothetical protein P691DRAFT_808753 [Macrolepiota fuliginosa MF-IS2]
MESTTTLVNPESHITRLVFSKDSTLNANLLENGQIRYKLSTTGRNAQHTRILDAITGTELALIQRRIFKRDKIVFNAHQGGRRDVVKEHKLDDGFTVQMISTEAGDFYWKMHPIHRLALFSVSDPIHPVVYRESVSEPKFSFALVVKREYESIINYVIPTFVKLEEQMKSLARS